MNATIRFSLTVITALSFIPGAHAASAKPVPVNVTQVNDRRTGGSFSGLSISMELPTILSTDVAASRVLVQTAQDDGGKSLLDPSKGEPAMDANRSGSFGPPDKKAPTRVSFELKNPDRTATLVKEIRGEVELFMPGKDSNSVATIPRFLSSSGKPLSNKTLKANGVEISLVSKAQLDAERKEVGDKRRAEAKAGGYEEGDDLESTVKNAMENFLTPDPGDVVLKVKDPNHRIQDISFIETGGEVKSATPHDVEGFTIVSRYNETPAPDWGLRISMQTEKNTVRYPFVLTDVPLP